MSRQEGVLPTGYMETVNELRERSKNDRAIIVGSEVRWLAMVIDHLEADRDAARAELGRLREALGKFDALWGIKLESESREELQALSDAFKYARAALAAKEGGG